MIFFAGDILWIFTIVLVIQIIKLGYHGKLLWVMKKKKLKFRRDRRKLKSLLVERM